MFDCNAAAQLFFAHIGFLLCYAFVCFDVFNWPSELNSRRNSVYEQARSCLEKPVDVFKCSKTPLGELNFAMRGKFRVFFGTYLLFPGKRSK
jgi:hypothetical protein